MSAKTPAVQWQRADSVSHNERDCAKSRARLTDTYCSPGDNTDDAVLYKLVARNRSDCT